MHLNSAPSGKTPLVSIIIPTYNRGGVIRKAIESALNQAYSHREIIVVDDGSTDDTEAVVSAFSGVTYIRQDRQGQGAARNKGLRHARGSFIASLDSDDTWSEGFLSRCMGKLQKHQLDFVFTNWRQETAGGHWVDSLERYDFLKPFLGTAPGEDWIHLDNPNLRKLYLSGCPSPSSSAVIRRSSMGSGWPENFKIADDWVLFLDILMNRKCSAAFTMEKLWYKKSGPDNVYDGRNSMEVLRYLGVEDHHLMIRRFSPHFTESELKFVRKIHTANMLKLSGMYLSSMNLKYSLALIRQVFRKEPVYLWAVLAGATQRKTARLAASFIKFFSSLIHPTGTK
ncbi:MAG: glycosyltransferase family 2 protein [Flavisolibacter sp.]